MIGEEDDDSNNYDELILDILNTNDTEDDEDDIEDEDPLIMFEYVLDSFKHVFNKEKYNIIRYISLIDQINLIKIITLVIQIEQL